MVHSAGVIQTVDDLGFPGISGDGGPAVEARLNAPYGLATDLAGNLYIADLGNNRLRKVSPDGVVSTVAGTGQAGSGGGGGKASLGALHGPRNRGAGRHREPYIPEFLGPPARLVTLECATRAL